MSGFCSKHRGHDESCHMCMAKPLTDEEKHYYRGWNDCLKFKKQPNEDEGPLVNLQEICQRINEAAKNAPRYHYETIDHGYGHYSIKKTPMTDLQDELVNMKKTISHSRLVDHGNGHQSLLNRKEFKKAVLQCWEDDDKMAAEFVKIDNLEIKKNNKTINIIYKLWVGLIVFCIFLLIYLFRANL